MRCCLEFAQNPNEITGQACNTVKGIVYAAADDLREVPPQVIERIVKRGIADITACQSNCSIYTHHARNGVPEGFIFPCDGERDDLAAIIGGTVAE